MKSSSIPLYLLTATLFAGSAFAQSEAAAPAAPATAAAPAAKDDFRPRTLQRFDANHDGKLDETERAAARAEWQKRGAEAREPGHGPGRFKGPGGPGGPREREFAAHREFREFRQFQKWKKMARQRHHRHERMRSAMLQRFDHNGDHRLNQAERGEARAAGKQARERFQAGRKEVLTRFDRNGDGRLDDTERKQLRSAWENFIQQQPVVTPAAPAAK